MRKIEFNLKELKKLYDSDMSLEAIAKRFGTNFKTLSQQIKLLGWKREPRIRRRLLDVNEILELRKLGLTKEEIMRKLKIDRKTFVNFEKRNGIFQKNDSRTEAYYKGQRTLNERKKKAIKPLGNNWSRLDKHKDKIQKLLLQGVTKAAIAERYNVCQSTLYKFVIRHALKVPVVRKLDGKKDKIIEMFRQGKSTKIMAKELKCSETHLVHEIKKLHLSRSYDQINYDSTLNRQEDLIIKLHNEGVSGTKIAKKLHVHPASIYRKLKALKLNKKALG